MQHAFKEWAIIVDALEQGRQAWVFRKGGIAEGRHGFQPIHPSFYLFPTYFHQQESGVIPGEAVHLEAVFRRQPPPDQVRFSSIAHVVGQLHVDHEEDLDLWDGHHGWQKHVLRERFHWGKTPGLHALHVRVHRLTTPVQIPLTPDLGGCRSWVMLPSPFPADPGVAALDDAAFATTWPSSVPRIPAKHPGLTVGT
jgi:hypothetical protein